MNRKAAVYRTNNFNDIAPGKLVLFNVSRCNVQYIVCREITLFKDVDYAITKVLLGLLMLVAVAICMLL